MARTIRGFLATVLLAGLAIGNSAATETANAQSPSSEPLLSTGETILGQPLAYPVDAALRVTAVVVTLLPGSETGWHRHNVPLFGYILEGELTVAYEGAGERLYRTGDALMEAIGTLHNGRNSAPGPVHILAVFMGAEGIPNTVRSE